MSHFKNIEVECKILSVTVSHQYRVVYINFTAFEDIKTDIYSDTKQVLIRKFEKAKFKLQFSDFCELVNLPITFTNKKIRLNVLVKHIEGQQIVDIVNDTKTVKILSLDPCEP